MIEDQETLPKQRMVCLVSSIHPIELAAFLILNELGVVHNDVELFVLYMSDRHKPESLLGQLLSSHDGLPIPTMLVDENEIVRPLFVPLGIGEQTNINAINAALGFYEKIGIRAAGDCATLLQRVNAARTRIASARSLNTPLAVAREISSWVLGETTQRRVIVESYEEYLRSPAGQNAVCRALTVLLREIAGNFQTGEHQLEFSRGGYLLATVDDQRHELRAVSFREGRLHIYDPTSSHGITIHYEPQSDNIELTLSYNVEISRCILELRGPLSLLFLSQVGLPIDVPWYLKDVSCTNSSDHAFVGVELISPVSASASRRVSLWSGGHAERLRPSGYSLIDFDEASALSFVKAVAQIPGILSFDNLADWRHLLDNYPRSDQKILKSQSGISQYVVRKVSDDYSSMKSGSVLLLEHLACNRAIGIPSMGAHMCALMALTKVLHAWSRNDRLIRPTRRQEQLLHQIGAYSAGGLNTSFLGDHVQQLLLESERWRQQIGRPLLPVNDLATRYNLNGYQDLLSGILDYCFLGTTEAQAIAKAGCVSLPLHQRILDETICYYRTVIGLCASVLKMHILNVGLVFSPEDLHHALKSLLKQREGNKIFRFNSRLWKVKT